MSRVAEHLVAMLTHAPSEGEPVPKKRRDASIKKKYSGWQGGQTGSRKFAGHGPTTFRLLNFRIA